MSDQPSSAKTIVLRATGGILATLPATLIGLLAPIGEWMQSHISTVAGLDGSAGAILYAWALWTYSLWKKDSKSSKIKAAKELGRPICGCTEAGEIMLATDWGTSFWRDHECPICKNKQQVKIRVITGTRNYRDRQVTIKHPIFRIRLNYSIMRLA